MKIYTLIILLLLITIKFKCFCQTKESKDTLVILTESAFGMERDKKVVISLPKKDLSQNGVSVLIGKPKNIRFQKEFFYAYNEFQYMFQTYCIGSLTRKQFLDYAESMNKNLDDTLLLSRKPIKCGISILVGLNSKKESIYIIDANSNNDYSDEVIRPLKYKLNYDSIINFSIPVLQEVYLNNRIVKEYILCFIDPKAPVRELKELGIVFPEFRYKTFELNRKYYTLWSPTLTFESEIYVHEGKKETLDLSFESPIKPGQYVVLGNTTFKYLKSIGNQKQIILGHETTTLFTKFIEDSILGPEKNISSQIGFIAPPIKGVNINITNFSDGTIDTQSMRGKYIFLDFWSTTCAPCIDDFKNIKKSFEQFKSDEVQIIGIVDEQSKDGAIKLLKKYGVLWPNIKSNSSAMGKNGYFIGSYPTTFLINPDGKIIFQNLRGDELFKKLNELKVTKNKESL